VTIAREMLLAVRPLVQGAQVSAPNGRYSSAVDVLEALGTSNANVAKGLREHELPKFEECLERFGKDC